MDSPAETGKKGTARKVTKKKVAEEPQEEEEEEIRCVCGVTSTDEDDGMAWIACDKCGVWQHNVCVGVSTFEDEIPDNYLCEEHDKIFHQDLLAAIAAGNPIWEERKEEWRRRQAQEELAKKKGKKGARKSEVGTNGKASALSTPVADSKKSTPAKGSKRKDRHESESNDKEPAKVNKVRKVTPAPVQQQQQQQQTPPSETPVKIIDLDSKRQGPAKLIHKALLHTIPIAVKTGVFEYAENDTLETKAERLAIQVEKAVLDTHGDGTYAKQCRVIGANLKQNQELSNGLLVKTITPLALAAMSSDDMVRFI
jgi:hypothetical protein